MSVRIVCAVSMASAERWQAQVELPCILFHKDADDIKLFSPFALKSEYKERINPRCSMCRHCDVLYSPLLRCSAAKASANVSVLAEAAWPAHSLLSILLQCFLCILIVLNFPLEFLIPSPSCTRKLRDQLAQLLVLATKAFTLSINIETRR
jgi:hypothetical protein